MVFRKIAFFSHLNNFIQIFHRHLLQQAGSLASLEQYFESSNSLFLVIEDRICFKLSRMLSVEILLSLKNHLLNIGTDFSPLAYSQSPQISNSYTLLFSDFLKSQLIMMSNACSPRSYTQE